MPKRKTTPIVGTITSEVRELDIKYFLKVESFQEDAKELIKEQDTRGEGSMYAYMQDEVRPEVSDLVENKERIDALCGMNIMLDGKETKVFRWCQGKINMQLKDSASRQ